MQKKLNKSVPRRSRTIRHMPDELWEEMNEHVRQTEEKQYVFIRDAIREKLEREKERNS
jgi:metal-responsive CopG/Arc/MetJ family transcriptional regulator